MLFVLFFCFIYLGLRYPSKGYLLLPHLHDIHRWDTFIVLLSRLVKGKKTRAHASTFDDSSDGRKTWHLSTRLVSPQISWAHFSTINTEEGRKGNKVALWLQMLNFLSDPKTRSPWLFVTVLAFPFFCFVPLRLGSKIITYDQQSP